MKILLVSMNSIHFVRWTEQLKDSGYDVYWFDILDGGKTDRLPWVHQIVDWKRKFKNLKGRYFFKTYMPFLYSKLHFLFEHKVTETFEKVIHDIKPDVVHSFVLQISCLPILDVMKRHKNIVWLYSSWGSDLYNKANKPSYENDLTSVLPKIDYLITDNLRDYKIANNYGFKGDFLGVFPGGGGFKYNDLNKDWLWPVDKRKTILVKGYQGKLGRCIEVIKALVLLKEDLKGYNIVIFGADEDVIEYIKTKNTVSEFSLQVFPRKEFKSHEDILKLMGMSLIYIGNSVSDGLPNTLLEAVVMGAFPIQSNPGGVTEEIITPYKNGLLIEKSNDIQHISELVALSIKNTALIKSAFILNQKKIKPKFEYTYIHKQVLKAYNSLLE
ncbi:glycosyltransferase [Flavivirga abyssicola]|uniref:glycosyltransferase n=1 Tax=Flavivirga abyssicola TaxID=3063533 RepID=UPI0026E0218B|nr:glycosyltransferase [Flavivirga sp. MEBiC07777]WVK13638.1 glycosyltransferase [Flavivirga sp. MEBiC07777]